MKKGSSDAAYYDARYNGYSGKRRFEVEHRLLSPLPSGGVRSGRLMISMRSAE